MSDIVPYIEKPLDKASTVLNQIDGIVETLAVAESNLERGYAYLGYRLLEVSEMQYWRIRFDSFREYLESLGNRFHKTAGCLHQYFLTVRDLSDTFSQEQLETIGITKAIQLRAAKDYALVLPQNVVEAALDPKVTAKGLKKLVSTTLKLPTDEPGEWMDLEFEFMVSPEEKATLQDAIDAALHTDPIVKSTVSKAAQMKEVALRWAMEYLGAHAGEVQ